MSVLGNGGVDAMTSMGGGEPRQSRIVSAASSVISTNSSLCSSSTKGSNGSQHIKSLAKHLSDNNTENESPKAVQSSAPALYPPKNAPAAPSADASSNPMVLHMGAPPHPVAEFLFQLTKMLTDNNPEYIEWRNASIFVHNPPGLEKDILPKYFRHSNYSSFQRQMNYFGFRKIAGKGKMAPCSYVNEAAKEDISSLLFIKRKKTGVSSAAAKLMAQQNRINRTMGAMGAMQGGLGGMGMAGNPLIAGPGNSLMMGHALNSMGRVPSTLNNFAMMGGGLPGVGSGHGMPTAGSAAVNETSQASLLREQQNMLAQLQQAHASAVNQVPNMGASAGAAGLPQAAQNKFNVGTGATNGINPMLLANDQGNVYTNPNGLPSDWNNSAEAQSLLLQQATAAGFAGGNFTQGMSAAASGAPADANNFTRIDSAANLRALINQQISMFNTTSSPVDFSSGMGAPMPASATGMVSNQAPTSQQVQGLTSIPAGTGAQGLSYDWNEMLTRMGAGTGAAGDNAGAANTIRQLEQQLLQQGGNHGAPGPAGAAGGQPFNLNGFQGFQDATRPQL